MTICTRGLGSKNLIPTSGLGAYDGTYTPPERGGAGSGILFNQITGRISNDMAKRLFDNKEKLITANQVINALPKKAVTEKVKIIKHELGVKAPEAREMLKVRIDKQIEALKIQRIEELNEQAIIMIMSAVIIND